MKNLLECFDVILNSLDLTEWLPDIEQDFQVEETGNCLLLFYVYLLCSWFSAEHEALQGIL